MCFFPSHQLATEVRPEKTLRNNTHGGRGRPTPTLGRPRLVGRLVVSSAGSGSQDTWFAWSKALWARTAAVICPLLSCCRHCARCNRPRPRPRLRPRRRLRDTKAWHGGQGRALRGDGWFQIHVKTEQPKRPTDRKTRPVFKYMFKSSSPEVKSSEPN